MAIWSEKNQLVYQYHQKSYPISSVLINFGVLVFSKELSQKGKQEQVTISNPLQVNMLSSERKRRGKKIHFISKFLFSKIIIVIIMENKNLKWILSQIDQDNTFNNELKLLEQEYLVKIYKISELTAKNVEELYNTMQKKFYLNRKVSNEEYWYENELRLFVWSLFAYLHITKKHISHLNEQDWKFFSLIFNFKSTIFFEFQAHSLMKPQGKPALWQERQTQLLQTIIKQKNLKNRWNSIARQLFVRSNKQYFRNPKQCRERWMNHLDPSKIHSEWSASQDLILLNCIKKKGKRWSIAVKQLSNTRTEHMVKNRYKSLISNQAKKYPGKRQSDIQTILIKKLSKTHEKISKESPKQNHSEALTKSLIKIEKHPKIIMKEEQLQLAKEKHQQPPHLLKQQIKIQGEMEGGSYFDKLDNQLNQFQASSPMFIPWNLEGCDNGFVGERKFKMDDNFYCHQSSEHQEYQQF